MKSQKAQKKKKAQNNLKAELVATRNQLARALADYDNLKRRVELERETFSEISKAQVITRLLPIFDMFEQVQEHLSDSGLGIALTELKEKLKEEGVSEISPQEDNEFDENTMEAIEAISNPKKAGKVAELSLKGYQMGDRILRYAKVVVFK